MLKTVLRASVLASIFAFTASSAQAKVITPQTWNFSYTGFTDYSTGLWNADARVQGSFVAIDHNQDGHIKANEVQSLNIQGQEYIGMSCSVGNIYRHCDLYNFDYQPGFGIAIRAFNDDIYPSGPMSAGFIEVGQSFYFNNYDMYAPENNANYTWAWSADTQFAITPDVITAVPEPTTYAMMGLGLAGLALFARRRKAAQSV